MTNELEDIADELREYADLDGTEAGEYWTALCEIARYPYAMSNEFEAAFRKEIAEQLDVAKDNIELPKEPPTEVSMLATIERLWKAGCVTKEQDGMWWLFDKHGEGIVSGLSLKDLCENIIDNGV